MADDQQRAAGPKIEQPSGFVALANGSAGSVDEASLGAAVSELATHAPTTLRRTESPDDVDDALDSLDGRRPVVIGGDGSLHLVVNRLISLDLAHVPLGLVPLGTGNDLARGAGLSLDPVDAACTAATGVPRSIAVALADDGEAVVNNAHLGLGAQAALRASGLKRYLGPLAYPTGALMAGVRPDDLTVHISVDGVDVFDGPAIALIAALGPSAGGGHELAPSADPTDPHLEILAVVGGPASRRLGVAVDVVRGRDPARGDGVERWSGRQVRVRATGGDTAGSWDVDGEPRDWANDVTLTIDDTRWHLVMPA